MNSLPSLATQLLPRLNSSFPHDSHSLRSLLTKLIRSLKQQPSPKSQTLLERDPLGQHSNKENQNKNQLIIKDHPLQQQKSLQIQSPLYPASLNTPIQPESTHLSHTQCLKITCLIQQLLEEKVLSHQKIILLQKQLQSFLNCPAKPPKINQDKQNNESLSSHTAKQSISSQGSVKSLLTEMLRQKENTYEDPQLCETRVRIRGNLMMELRDPPKNKSKTRPQHLTEPYSVQLERRESNQEEIYSNWKEEKKNRQKHIVQDLTSDSGHHKQKKQKTDGLGCSKCEIY